MTKRTEVKRDYHSNGTVSRTVEKVEHPSGMVDQHETFFSTSGVRFDFLVCPFGGEYGTHRRSISI